MSIAAPALLFTLVICCRPGRVFEVLAAIEPRRLIRRGVDGVSDGAPGQQSRHDLLLPGFDHCLPRVRYPLIHPVILSWLPGVAPGGRSLAWSQPPAFVLWPAIGPKVTQPLPFRVLPKEETQTPGAQPEHLYTFYAKSAILSIRLQFWVQKSS